MNAYLLTKCRSEQQLLNELAKLVAAALGGGGALGGGDTASKKTMELLRELAVVYASPAPPQAAPHSVVKDLSSLLALLKDRKDDLRAARLVLCLLTRLAEQFERRYALHAAGAALQRTQSFELCVSVMASLLKALEAAELSHASLPRQCVALRLFALLCRAFGGDKSDAMLAKTRAALLQSPAFVLLLPLASGAKTLSAADKKQISSVTGKKDFPAQLASLGAATHAIRFHVPTSSVVADSTGTKSGVVVDALVQAAFLPNCSASRHAAATLLAVFTSDLPDQQGAKAVLRAVEAFVFKFRAVSLRVVGDPLATIYLLRLCGHISRLEVADEASSAGGGAHVGSFTGAASASASAVSELLDLSFESPSPKHASPPPSPRKTPLMGVTVSRELADRLRDWVVDVVVSAGNASTPLPSATRAVVMTAVEEVVTDASPTSSTGRTGVFDVVATTLLKMLRDPATASNAPLLHRLCRVAQFAAESFDRATMKQQSSELAGSPLQRVSDCVAELVTHGNAFIACEALRAQIWLLPRQQAAPDVDDAWNALVSRLVALPVDRILPESRRALADALFRRAVATASAANGADAVMLSHCLAVTLCWFQSLPCEWHAATLIAVWQTILLGQPQRPQEPPSTTDARRRQVLESIAAVLDAQHAQRELQPVMHLVQQSALAFLCRDGSKLSRNCSASCCELVQRKL